MREPQYYEERAKNFFHEGYNCAQSVVAAFCEELGLELSQAVRMASSFGGGMGRMREVCGCVSGMLIITGYLYGYDDPKAYEQKKDLYEKVQKLMNKFKEDNGSYICKELLGQQGADNSFVPSERTSEYYKKRPCNELAGYAAYILAEFILNYPSPKGQCHLVNR